MAFDKSKDKLIASETLEFENMNIIVGVYSYNESAKKIGFSRLVIEEGKEKFIKTGRFTKDETEKIIPAMQKMLEVM